MGRATILLFSLFLLQNSYATELKNISDSTFLADGDTLVSPTGIFELGFFRPGSSENRYLGIWYKNISVRTVVWVANRDRPVHVAPSPIILRITNQQTLGLFYNTTMIWSSNTTTTTIRSGIVNATAKLQDTGNLLVIDQRENILWQSFDYPTDTLLPGMKLGRDYVRRKEWHLTSWKSNQDPARGELTWGPDAVGYPESKLKQSGKSIQFRGGPWRNQRFTGISSFNKSLTFTYDVTVNKSEVSFAFNVYNIFYLTRVTLNSSGHLESWTWVEDGRGWQRSLSFPRDTCDTYNTCNAYAICNVDAIRQYCSCLDEKFVPKDQKSWETSDWSGGCVRRTPLECEKGSDGFVKYSYVKLPDTENTRYNMSMSLEECRVSCLQNCSCMAYASPDPSLERGCLMWFDDLLDIRVLPEGSGAGGDFFVRIAASEVDSQSISKKKSGRARTKIILLVIFPGLFLTGCIFICFFYSRRKRNHSEPTGEGEILNASKRQDESMDHVSFQFSTIANATLNFSSSNKLGEGGFGPVYKGMLEDGQEIAVKRLSRNSAQGLDEFKNEVVCISKLQHRNLVKLLGYCIHGVEKLLIYEYMPNKSLDSFIFDETKSVLLDWTKRVNIIKGIAGGLVYLHQDSRLRIIHRDLKASNILLDQDMNPRISDFGLARSFGGNETQANTERVVGTYGYMSPEYALDGIFSIKSDVYSFGVLVLEIVTGKRNRGYINPENENNLFGHVWSLYNEGRSLELIDPSCAESCHRLDVMRSIHVGLLCIQENAADRPNMSSIILMLGSEGELQQPKKPSFFTEPVFRVANISSSTYTGGSVNEITITEVDPR